MNPRLLIAPFPLNNGQRRSVRRKTPIVVLREIIFDLKHLTAFSFERIEGKERKLALCNNTVDTQGCRGARTLMITDPVCLQNLLRETSGEGHAHERNRPTSFSPIRIHDIEKLSAVGTEAPLYDHFVAPNQQLRHRLINGLLVDPEVSTPVRHENYCSVVRRPVERNIPSIIEGQPSRFADAASSFQLGHINVRLRNTLHVHDPLTVA